jgi:aquaporin Z
VALAFGFVLLALAYALGPVSGCHVSPALTLAVFLRWRISAREAVVDWSARVSGALLGGAVGARWPRTSCHFAALRYTQTASRGCG